MRSTNSQLLANLRCSVLLLLQAVLCLSLWSQTIPATLEWKSITNGVIFSSPVIDESGVVYVGSNDNNLTAFNSDGSIKWTFTTGNWVDSSPALSKDENTVYVGSWDNYLYAVNSMDGSLAWSFETSSYVTSSPAVDLNGRVYFGSMDSIFYALESNGSVAWEYFVGQPVFSSPAIGENGTLYFGDENGTLHALNSDGTVKWTYEVEDVADTNKSILSSPALDTLGNIYFGSGNGFCYSLSDDGGSASLNWKYETGDRVDSSPVLGINEEVIFVSRDGYMRSLPIFSATTENLPNWEVFTGDVFYSSPVVDENGRIYVIGYTGGENHLFAFDANGTKAWDSNVSSPPFEIGSVVDSSLLLNDEGKLYFGCFDKNLYCIDLGVGPADSHWPMFGRTRRRDSDWPSHGLTLSISGSTGGSVSGEGTYYQGSSASISAVPDTGYSFNGWTGEGVTDPTQASTSVSMGQSRNISASFAINSYDLSVAAGQGGSVSGSGSFQYGSSASISAIPDTGYSFAGWTGEGISDLNSSATTVQMTQTRNVSANFSLNSYELTLLTGTGGSVTGEGTYNHGTNPSITAFPDNGYSFAGWSGEGVSDPNIPATTVSMSEARTISASFSLNSYELILLAGTGGSVTGGGTFDHGSTPLISATASTGYTFSGWSGEGTTDPNASSTTIIMLGDQNVSALFSLNSYPLTVLAGTGGTVSGAGTYSFGSTPSISATPNYGYLFDSWTGEGVTEPSQPTTTVGMESARTVSANFSLKSYTLNVLSGTGGTASGTGSYTHGTLVEILATPEPDYSFQGWTGDGISDPASTQTTVLVTSDQNISANFNSSPVEDYLLTLSASPLQAGILTGGGNYQDEQNVSIFAAPQYGYSFDRWSGHNIANPTDANTSFTIDSNVSLTAHFEPLVFSVSVEYETGGQATGSGNYDYGSDQNISAEPSNGYTFSHWEGNGTADPFVPETTVHVTEDLTVRAIFSPLLYKLGISASVGGHASFNANNPLPYGSSVRIDAVPEPGYIFSGWTGENIDSPSSASSTVVILNDTNITANFEPEEKQVFSLIILKNISQAGIVSGAGFFEEGQYVQISASSNPGFRFSHWLGNGIDNPLSSQTQIFLDSDSLATASFALSELSVFLESEYLENQWFSSWLGTIYQTDTGWIYHAQLGWIYPQITESGIWIWKETMGWLWTNNNIYLQNFIWLDRSDNWIYLDQESLGHVRMYDYQSAQWMDWPD